MDKTARSYELGAGAYLARTKDRGFLSEIVPRFTRHLAGDLVFDVGCGPGFDGTALRAHGLRVVGVDYSMAMMRTGRPHYPGAFVCADMRRLPIAPIADGLWVNSSMLHIEREGAPSLMTEFRRVLRPGGILFVSVKAGSGTHWETGPHDFPPRRFTYWQPNEFDALLDGFAILDSWGGAAPREWMCRIARRA